MTAFLIHTDSPRPNRVELTPGIHTVGRDPDTAVQIDHPSVSGRHCALIIQADGSVLVRDLDSTNGTFLDGERITAAPMSAEQVVTLGEVHLSLDVERPPIRIAAPTAAVRVVRPKVSGPVNHVPAPALAATVPTPDPSFWSSLPGAFRYPLQEDAVLTIAILVAITYAPMLLQGVAPTLGAAVAIVGLVVGIIVGLYVFHLMRDVILTTVHGKDDFPPTPDFSLDLADIRETLLTYAALSLVCFGPAMILARIPNAPVWGMAAAVVLGCLYFPMALLGFAVFDSLGSLNPMFIARSIGSAPGPYLTIVALGGAIVGGGLWLDELLSGFSRWITLGIGVLSSLVSYFLLLAWVRLLGLFYRCHRERLGWGI